MNVIGAPFVEALLTAHLISSNVGSDTFNLWLEFIPKLSPHAVIVMDNATFHKRSDTKNMIKGAGHSL